MNYQDYRHWLTGAEVRALMRTYHKTIRVLAAQMDITQKRVRTVRERGVRGTVFVQDWIEAIQS